MGVAKAKISSRASSASGMSLLGTVIQSESRIIICVVLLLNIKKNLQIYPDTLALSSTPLGVEGISTLAMQNDDGIIINSHKALLMLAGKNIVLSGRKISIVAKNTGRSPTQISISKISAQAQVDLYDQKI